MGSVWSPDYTPILQPVCSENLVGFSTPLSTAERGKDWEQILKRTTDPLKYHSESQHIGQATLRQVERVSGQ